MNTDKLDIYLISLIPAYVGFVYVAGRISDCCRLNWLTDLSLIPMMVLNVFIALIITVILKNRYAKYGALSLLILYTFFNYLDELMLAFSEF